MRLTHVQVHRSDVRSRGPVLKRTDERAQLAAGLLASYSIRFGMKRDETLMKQPRIVGMSIQLAIPVDQTRHMKDSQNCGFESVTGYNGY